MKCAYLFQNYYFLPSFPLPHSVRFIKFTLCNGPRHSSPHMIRHLMGRAGLCWAPQIGYRPIPQGLWDDNGEYMVMIHLSKALLWFPRKVYMQQWSEAKKKFPWKKKMGGQWNLSLEIFKENYMLELRLEKINLNIQKMIWCKSVRRIRTTKLTFLPWVFVLFCFVSFVLFCRGKSGSSEKLNELSRKTYLVKQIWGLI